MSRKNSDVGKSGRGNSRPSGDNTNGNGNDENPSNSAADSGGNGDGKLAAIIIDPGKIGAGSNGDGDNASGEPRAKRSYRKRGSTGPKASGDLNTDILTRLLLNVHMFASGVIPEMALDEDEANKIATSYANLAQFYDITHSAKSIAWADFLSVLGMVYGTRIMAIRVRRGMEKAEQKSSAPRGDNIVDIPGVTHNGKPVFQQ